MSDYDFSGYICWITGLPCCGCSLFCEHRKEKQEDENDDFVKHGKKEDNAMPMMLYLSTNGNPVFTAEWQLWVLVAILLIGIIMFVIIIRKT